MYTIHRHALTFLILTILMVAPLGATAGDRLWHGSPVKVDSLPTQHFHPACLSPMGNPDKLGNLERANAWSLPAQALAADFDTTIHCLVLRFNFPYETTDDPNTTGRGQMDMSRPLDTLSDSAYIIREGYLIDPPPHDSAYFDAHMQALDRYWERVSEGKIHLTWDIYPPVGDSVYELPQPQSYYGRCSFSEVVIGLENYFIDCIQLADTAHIIDPSHPDIDFGAYQAIFLFHAGSDRQNDIGFPETCSDLFTGWIRFGDSLAVDGGANYVRTALMMPETAIQDGRITALNAVMAHEFGHQLGLVDLYSTSTFRTQLGDFALMDNNGFGTAADFGWPGGNVFGVFPIYPMAWSRAYLGLTDVREYRNDTTGVRLTAAELYDADGPKIARIPITEDEYFLLEARVVDTDGKTTFVWADSETSVILGPSDTNKVYTGEYDDLIPGNGLLAFHVDEAVAAADYDGDGLNNFLDNQLQVYVPSQQRKFIRLLEADGRVDFGGYYSRGHGEQSDFFRDDQNDRITPFSNPSSNDNSGNKSHIYVTNIKRDTVPGTNGQVLDDRYILFDLEFDRRAQGFPIRCRAPQIGLSPIAADLDDDGSDEALIPANNLLCVVDADGNDFIRGITECDTLLCPLYYDTAADYLDSLVPTTPIMDYPVPLFRAMTATITAGPVVGRFGGTGPLYVAVGYPTTSTAGRVMMMTPTDNNDDARADSAMALVTARMPIAMSFGERLWVLTDGGRVQVFDSLTPSADTTFLVTNDMYHGICRLDDNLILMAGDSLQTTFYLLNRHGADTLSVPGVYYYGPVLANLDLDGFDEVIAFSQDGDGIIVSVAPEVYVGPSPFTVVATHSTHHAVTANPSIGDVDNDGYPDIIVGSTGRLFAYDRFFTLKTDFPKVIDDGFPDSAVIATPMVADIDNSDLPEQIFPTSVGNVYALSDEPTLDFPLPSGEQVKNFTNSVPIIFGTPEDARIGWMGGDGWFYAWHTRKNNVTSQWPMNGADASASFRFDVNRLPEIPGAVAGLDESKFYNYPNPVKGNETTIRYYLGDNAESVKLDIYDLTGELVKSLSGDVVGGLDHEVTWDCSDVTPGVYRCVIRVDQAGSELTAFKDIAIVR